mgnify:CR=1 FL=1
MPLTAMSTASSCIVAAHTLEDVHADQVHLRTANLHELCLAASTSPVSMGTSDRLYVRSPDLAYTMGQGNRPVLSLRSVPDDTGIRRGEL